MSEPREWWIRPDVCTMPVIYDHDPRPMHHSCKGEVVHVIEKSAYDAVVRERDGFKYQVACLDKQLAAEKERAAILEHHYNSTRDSLNAIKEQRDQARAEVERLKVYEKTVWEYVQCTGNTSPKTLGYHVAEALVMDHKDLKAEVERLKGELHVERGLSGASTHVWETARAERTRYRLALERIAVANCDTDLIYTRVHRLINIAREALG